MPLLLSCIIGEESLEYIDINLMSYNVDWFRNGKRTSTNSRYINKDIDLIAYKNIIKEVKYFLDNNENAIAFLQETAYKIKIDDKENPINICDKLNVDFPNSLYDIKLDNKSAKRYTLAISKKGSFEEVNDYFPKNNRTIAMKFKSLDLIILGVHMPTNFKINSAEEKMWNELIAYSKTITSPFIILGDFNAYINCDNLYTKEKFKKLVLDENIIDITPNEETFIGKTTIDRVLIKNIAKENVVNIKVQKEDFINTYSDHKYIKTKIKFKI